MKWMLLMASGCLLGGCDLRCIETNVIYLGELRDDQEIYMSLSKPTRFVYDLNGRKNEPLAYEVVQVDRANALRSYCEYQGDDEPWLVTAWVSPVNTECPYYSGCEPGPTDLQVSAPFTFLREGVTTVEIELPAAE